MAYKDVLIPILEKWRDRGIKYNWRSGDTNLQLQKYTTTMLVYDVINEETPEDALRILKFKRDFAEQTAERTPFLNINMLDEGVEDVKKLVNYHNKFRKVKRRAYSSLDDIEDKFRQSLMQMTEDKLYAECKRYIKLSAYAMNNPSSAYHTRVMDCYNECKRRGTPQLYHAAYSEVHSELFGKGRKVTTKRPVKKTKKATRRKK